jgi:hypothetical protein
MVKLSLPVSIVFHPEEIMPATLELLAAAIVSIAVPGLAQTVLLDQIQLT